jgi:hypothetical protein
MTRKVLLLVPVMVVGSATLFAPLPAQSPIATDRPGLAFSPVTVPQGALQLEVGLPHVALQDEGGIESTTVSVPVLALRYGVHDRIELRAASPLYNHAELVEGPSETSRQGSGDLEVGAKWHAWVDEGRRPDLSIVGTVVLPIGEEPFTIARDRPGYSLNGVSGWRLGPETALTTVAGASWVPDGDDEWTTTANLVVWLGRPFTERISGYVEGGWFPTDGGTTTALAGAGLALAVTPDLQLDAFFDRGLDEDAIDWLFGAGMSARL